MTLSSDQRAAIRQRAEAATKGPWEWCEDKDSAWLAAPSAREKWNPVLDDGSANGEYGATIDPHGPDGQFLAHAREDIPRLLEDIAEAEADIRDLLTTLDHARARIAELEKELLLERVRGVSLLGQLLQPDEAHDEPADQQQYRGHDSFCESRRSGMACDCGWGEEVDDDTGNWFGVSQNDPRVVALFRRHYSCRGLPASTYYAHGIGGPGATMTLLLADGRALWQWRLSSFRRDGQTGVYCAVFRNESPLRASDLVREADDLATAARPDRRRHFTFVDAARIAHKRQPGRCFLLAGWRYAEPRYTAGGLLILERGCW